MKCDEPKVYKVYTTRNEGAFGFCEGSDPTDIELEHETVCLKSEVDAAIAEIKEENESLLQQNRELCQSLHVMYSKEEYGKLQKEIAALKAKLEDAKASHYADSVDAGMRERRLRRALYKACSMWADRTRLICSVFGSNAPKIRWERMYEKCLKKAKEFR